VIGVLSLLALHSFIAASQADPGKAPGALVLVAIWSYFLLRGSVYAQIVAFGFGLLWAVGVLATMLTTFGEPIPEPARAGLFVTGVLLVGSLGMPASWRWAYQRAPRSSSDLAA
jgi:hypothetical protein